MPGSTRPLPFWTWPVSAGLLVLGALVSVWLEARPGGAVFFLPLYIGLVLVQWWGLRVVVCCYASGVLSQMLIGHGLPASLVEGLPELVVPWLSYELFGRRTRGGLELGHLRHLLRWLAFGFGIPVTLGTAMLVGALVLFQPLPPASWAAWFGAFWIGDLLGSLALTVPALMLLSAPMDRRGWTLRPAATSGVVESPRPRWSGVLALGVAMLVTALALPLRDYWFLQGVYVLAAALAFGAAPASVLSGIVVSMVLLSPSMPSKPDVEVYDTPDFNLRLGLGVLCTAAVIAGRTVSDARKENARRQESEEALRDSEQRYRSLLGHVPDTVVEVRCDGTIVLGNRLPGGGEVRPGSHIDDSLPAALVPLVFDRVNQACHSGRVESIEARLPAGRGEADWVLRIVPLSDDGLAEGALVLGSDVTDQRRAQDEINRASKLESLGALAGGMAHDFNKLLQTMLSTAELARRRAGDEGAREAFDRIARTARHAGTLTQQLLAFAGKGPLQQRSLDLGRCTAAVCDLLGPAVPSNVAVHLAGRNGQPPILADEGQVEQVVLNLVLNAVEAIGRDEPGEVQVTLEAVTLGETDLPTLLPPGSARPGPHLRLSVIDSGPGLDGDHLERLFEPFFTTKPQGRGLGLAAVLGIVRAHHGGVGLGPAPGGGARFDVYWPRAPNATRAATEAPSPPAQDRSTQDAPS